MSQDQFVSMTEGLEPGIFEFNPNPKKMVARAIDTGEKPMVD